MTAPRPGSRAEQRRRTEARILDAATEVFFSAGYDRTTIRAVASAAGVDAGLVMHYFGSKQELYRLMRELADQGAAILFYSTDYDELIGCCDRVAILYQGRILRELRGAEITEHNIVASALNLGLGNGAEAAA